MKSFGLLLAVSGNFKAVDMLENINGKISAFGDFNGDRLIDIVTILGSKVCIYQSLRNSFSLDYCISVSNVVNVIPADFDYDGALELLVSTTRNNYIYKGGKLIAEFRSDGQPFLTDYYSDFRSTLVGNLDNSLVAWSFNETSMISKKVPHCVLSDPHYSAFVDLDGDCVSDLFLMCKEGNQISYQIWLNREGSYISHSNTTHKFLPISFADMDSDGAIDIVYYDCNSITCYLHIAYNQQTPFCDGPRCRNKNELCKADPNFKINLLGNEDHLKLDLSPIVGQMLRADQTLRIADFNNDGFPDIMFMTSNRVEILQSIFALQIRSRSFVRIESNELNIGKEPPEVVTWLDVDEDGDLDVIVLRKNGQYDTFLNKFKTDGYFLKILVLNGACTRWCRAGSGAHYIGGTLKYSKLDNHGNFLVSQGASMIQSAHSPLLLPYSIFGLASNNYIEEVFLGTPKSIHSYPGLIPNSHLVINPGDDFSAQLYMNPSTTTFGIILVLTIFLATLGLVIYALERWERWEDEQERMMHLHLLNFDAL